MGELLDARLSLEVPIAGRAAVNADAEVVARLEQAIADAVGHQPGTEPFNIADSTFHAVLAEASGNQLLFALTGWILEVLQPTLIVKISPRVDAEAILAQHRAILRAVRRNQRLAAEKAMAAHIEYLSRSSTRASDARRGQTPTSELRAAIVSGELQPNERLVEADLSGKLGAGRSAVRTALTRLAQEGLIEQERNRGARVRKIGKEEAIQIYEARAALEALAARPRRRSTPRPRTPTRCAPSSARCAARLDAGDLLGASDHTRACTGGARHRRARDRRPPVGTLNSHLRALPVPHDPRAGARGAVVRGAHRDRRGGRRGRSRRRRGRHATAPRRSDGRAARVRA